MTDPAFPLPGLGLAALRRLTWWVTVACLLLIAVLTASELPRSTRSTVVQVAGSAAVAIVCATAGVLFAASILGRSVLRRQYRRGMVVTATLLAGFLLGMSRVVAEGGFPWSLPLAALLAAHAAGGRPWRTVWPAGLGFALVASLLGSWWGGALSWTGALEDAVIVALGAGGVLAQVWMLRVAERLDQARRLAGAAAVTDERLRFAADLHDIQGHSLQVIALKSELAERLAGTDPDRAVAEIREVQALARQVLGDTRAVVQGYRRVTLETEMTNAGRVLSAAGIDCRIQRGGSLGDLPEAVASLVGLVVREGTTNVLRHSAARRCAIVLTAEARVVRLRMGNDGPLGERPGAAGGLAVLADRLRAAGGELDWRVSAGEFVVEAMVPIVADAGFGDGERVAGVRGRRGPAASAAVAGSGPGGGAAAVAEEQSAEKSR